MTSHKEHKEINYSLVEGWYGTGQPRESTAIEDALDFIVSSPYEEKTMIEARDQINEALAGPVEDRVGLMEFWEQALLAAHKAALLFVREQDSQEDVAWIRDRVTSVEVGEYLYEYGDGTDEVRSVPLTIGDDELDAIRRCLYTRGLRYEADDIGWLVVPT